MATITKIFNEVTTEFTGGNDQALVSLKAATSAVSVLVRAETLTAFNKNGRAQLCFVTSPDALTGLSIAQLKSKFNGVIKTVDVYLNADVGFVSAESDVFSVSGLYFGAWLETVDIAKLKVSAWVAEF